MNLQAEAQEKKKRKKRVKRSSSPPRTPPSYSLLPDEIMENCLARVPRSYYPKLSQVSKSFRSILSSSDLYAARSRLGNTQQCLYVCLEGGDYMNGKYLQWISFSINPNQKNNTIGLFSVPNIPLPSCATSAKPIVVGSEIYVIGGCDIKRSSRVRVLDCRSHTWRDTPSMNVARRNPNSCVYDGKIYVIGGISRSLQEELRGEGIISRVLEDEFWGEVFDIKTQTWERFPSAFDFCGDYEILEFEGKIYIGNGNTTTCAYYDPKQCKWQKSATLLKLPQPEECVMDNVSYSFEVRDGQYNLWWRDINGGDFKEVKGLVSLENRYKRHCGSIYSTIRTTSYGGKVYVMWEGRPKKNYYNGRWKICCAEISVEKRDGDEIWGNVEWLGVVHTFSTLRRLLHCSAISL